MIWYFIGILNLLRLTWQDIKNNRNVDDRYNYFMMGASIMLLTIFPHTILYIFAVIIVIIALSIAIKKYSILGDADANTIIWSFIGWAYIGLDWLLLYAALVIAFVFGTVNIHRMMYKKSRPLPIYHSFLIAFILTVILKYI